jgi:hypothetical protein
MQAKLNYIGCTFADPHPPLRPRLRVRLCFERLLRLVVDFLDDKNKEENHFFSDKDIYIL